MSPAFRVLLLPFLFPKKRETLHKRPLLNCRSIFFSIQDKEDDTQHEIHQDQPLLEQTLLMMESTSSRDNRDIIIDATLFSENLAEVRNRNTKVFSFALFVSVSLSGRKTIFSKMITKIYTANSLVNAHIIIWIDIYEHAFTNVWQ